MSVFGGGPTPLLPVQYIQTPIVAKGRLFPAAINQLYAFVTN